MLDSVSSYRTFRENVELYIYLQIYIMLDH